MSKKIFVDTGAFIALANTADQYHLLAKNSFYDLQRPDIILLTSNFILDEAYTRLCRKAGPKVAITFGEKVQASLSLKIVSIDRSIEKKAWEIFKKYWDQSFSYTDCTSFALMRAHKIVDAFAFDKDFSIFGFSLIPGK